MNHSGDTNKMVSDTPRTDAALLYSICLDLQDENNALKDRINRLEREVELLRLYGNKDCTAQADEVLKKEDKP